MKVTKPNGVIRRLISSRLGWYLAREAARHISHEAAGVGVRGMVGCDTKPFFSPLILLCVDEMMSARRPDRSEVYALSWCSHCNERVLSGPFEIRLEDFRL
jgi:hypothetical protein